MKLKKLSQIVLTLFCACNLGNEQRKAIESTSADKEIVSRIEINEPNIQKAQLEDKKSLVRQLEEMLEYYNSNKVPSLEYSKETDTKFIERLQETLSLHHYYCAKPTGILDDATIEAINLYRRRNALNGKGIDATLVRHLSASSKKRIKLLSEAKKALSYAEDTHIYVNLPEFRLRLYINNELRFSMDLVIGKTTHKGVKSNKWHTNVQHGTISYAIINPWWYVPAGDMTEEIKEQLQRNKALRQYVEQFVGGKWELIGDNKVRGSRFRQRPGVLNPLGSIAYPLNSGYGELLHGTPKKGLFEKNVRAFSHGCMRLQDEIKFFKVLQNYGFIPDLNIESLLAEQHNGLPRTQNVYFLQSIPVDVVYVRAWVEEGRCGPYMTMPPDIYGYGRSIVK